MGINCSLQDENGSTIKEEADSSNLMSRFVLHDNLGPYRLMKYLDPYGNSSFNQLQFDDLLRDLEMAKASSSAAEFKQYLSRVIRLVEEAKQSVHTYIKFIGD